MAERPLLSQPSDGGKAEVVLQSAVAALHEAEDETQALRALKRVDALLVSTPSLRDPARGGNNVKSFLINASGEKRVNDPHVWTVGVAAMFGRVLRAFDLPVGEVLPGELSYGVSEEVESGGGEQLGTGSGGGGGGPGMGYPDPEGGTMSDDDPYRAATVRPVDKVAYPAAQQESVFDVPLRRRQMMRFCAGLLIVFVIVLLVPFIKNKKVGVYFGSNLLLWVTSVYGFLVAWRPGPLKRSSRHMHLLSIELYLLLAYAALWTGAVLSLIYLMHVESHVDIICENNPGYCDHMSMLVLHKSADAAAFCLGLSFVLVYIYGLKVASAYLVGMQLWLSADPRAGVTKTSLTPFVNWLMAYAIPGGACMRRHTAMCCNKRATSDRDSSLPASCRYPTSGEVGAFGMTFCCFSIFAMAVICTVICLASSDDSACVFSAILWDVIEVFSTSHNRS